MDFFLFSFLPSSTMSSLPLLSYPLFCCLHRPVVFLHFLFSLSFSFPFFFCLLYSFQNFFSLPSLTILSHRLPSFLPFSLLLSIFLHFITYLPSNLFHASHLFSLFPSFLPLSSLHFPFHPSFTIHFSVLLSPPLRRSPLSFSTLSFPSPLPSSSCVVWSLKDV